ncbi:MAG TPA: hypothetical protein DCY06_04975 [Bacteroidetes bacterium]|nr:hypothetical protein [Bacteroidota bacterium]
MYNMKLDNIKILLVSHSPFLNGAEIALYNLATNLDKNKFEVHMVFPFDGPIAAMAKKAGIFCHFTPMERWIRFVSERPNVNCELSQRVDKLCSLIKELGIDIVHSNTSVLIEGAIAAALTNTHHVWHIHEFLKQHPELRLIFPIEYVYNVIEQLSDKVVSVSDFVKSQFEFQDKGKLVTVYNGIEESHVLNQNNYIREHCNLNESDLIVIAVGLLSRTKGFTTFLETANLTAKAERNIKFVWVGGNSSNSLRMFRRFVKKNNLENSVFYLGHRMDVRQLIESSDMLICTSILETFSLTIVEAMSVKKPVISTNCGGPVETILDNHTGYLIPIDDSSKMSELILELSGNKQKRESMGKNGYKQFMERFTLDKHVTSIGHLYSELSGRYIDNDALRSRFLTAESILQVYEKASSKNWSEMKESLFSKILNRM